jgi:hypothetical protein
MIINELKMIEIILLLILFITSIAAQISITSPSNGTVYTAGSIVSITWTSPEVNTIIQIQLVQGSATALQIINNIATDISASSFQYSWTIPVDIIPAYNYALSIGKYPNIYYSHYFTIQAVSTTSSIIIPSVSSTSIVSSFINTPTISPSPNSPSLGTGAIVGIAIGGLVVGIIIGLFIFYFNRKNRHKQPAVMKETLPSYNQQKPDTYIMTNSKPDDTYTNKPDHVD